MERIADPHTYDQVVQAEIAIEIMNSARAILHARIYEVEESDPAERNRLFEKAKELYALQRAIEVTDDAGVQAVIETWGPRVKDEERFWREL